MAEKDPKKVDEKAGTQTNTVQLTPEMTLFLSTLTNTYQTIQKNIGGAQLPLDGETQPKEFTEDAKTAVEKFNDILAGLELKHPLTPALNPLTPNTNPVQLIWRMPQTTDTLSGFKIQRAQGSNNPFIDIAPVPADKRDYSDGTVTAGTTYRYRVVALTTKRGEFTSNVQEVQIS